MSSRFVSRRRFAGVCTSDTLPLESVHTNRLSTALAVISKNAYSSHFYRPQVVAGRFFTSMCQESCPQRGVCIPEFLWTITGHMTPPVDTLRQTPPVLRHTPLGRHPHPLSDTTGYGHQAGGMHPGGMHSCLGFFASLSLRG